MYTDIKAYKYSKDALHFTEYMRNAPKEKAADNNGHSLFHLLSLHQIQLLLLNNNNKREPTVAKAIYRFKPSSVITLTQTNVLLSRANQRRLRVKVLH